jgi:hypothetical protein
LKDNNYLVSFISLASTTDGNGISSGEKQTHLVCYGHNLKNQFVRLFFIAYKCKISGKLVMLRWQQQGLCQSYHRTLKKPLLL